MKLREKEQKYYDGVMAVYRKNGGRITFIERQKLVKLCSSMLILAERAMEIDQLAKDDYNRAVKEKERAAAEACERSFAKALQKEEEYMCREKARIEEEQCKRRKELERKAELDRREKARIEEDRRKEKARIEEERRKKLEEKARQEEIREQKFEKIRHAVGRRERLKALIVGVLPAIPVGLWLFFNYRTLPYHSAIVGAFLLFALIVYSQTRERVRVKFCVDKYEKQKEVVVWQKGEFICYFFFMLLTVFLWFFTKDIAIVNPGDFWDNVFINVLKSPKIPVWVSALSLLAIVHKYADEIFGVALFVIALLLIGVLVWSGHWLFAVITIFVGVFLVACAIDKLEKSVILGALILGVPLCLEIALSFDEEDKKVIESLYRAADQGSALAQAKVGLAYFEGEGGDQDYAEAEKWFRMAAEQGGGGEKFSVNDGVVV